MLEDIVQFVMLEKLKARSMSLAKIVAWVGFLRYDRSVIWRVWRVVILTTSVSIADREPSPPKCSVVTAPEVLPASTILPASIL